MIRIPVPLAALGLLFACTPEENNTGGGSQNYPEEFAVTGDALDITDNSATLTGYANLPFELRDAEVGIMYDKQQSFEGAKMLAATRLDGNNMFAVTATGLEPSTTHYYKSYVKNGTAAKYGFVKSFTTKESTIPAGAVDLGIEMTRDDGSTYKLYWAKSNLSESGLCVKPEDYGDYYAWGETETKSIYSWSTYTLGTSSSGPFSKYNTSSSHGTVDNKNVLEPEDDAAHVVLGGKWRMPTNAEWSELRTNCNWTWTTQNGVKGRLVTSKTNGNSIFLPAAGYRVEDYLNKASSFGFFWSSSLSTTGPDCALSEHFYSDYVGRCSSSRCYGYSVRPVTE